MGSGYRTNRAAQIRAIGRIEHALAVVAEQPQIGADDVITRIRPLCAGLVGALALATVVGCILVAIYWSALPNG